MSLQALPSPLATVSSKPLLAEDNIPCILLSSDKPHYQAFNGVHAAGPVPTMTSLDPEESQVRLQDDHARFHAQLQKLSSRFLKPEYVALKEAQLLVKKPRQGTGAPLFLRSYHPDQPDLQQASKKQKISAESGGFSHIL